MKKAMNHSLQLVPPLSAASELQPPRRMRVERAAAELRAASVSRAPRTSSIDIAWDMAAEGASFPPVTTHRETVAPRRELAAQSFFHATPAWVGVPSRSGATSTMPGLGPALLPPPASQRSNERPLLTALIIAATVMVGFGVGFGTSFGASVGATLMRLSLVAPPAEAPVVHAAVAAARPLLPVATAALLPELASPPATDTAPTAAPSAAPVAPVEVALRAPAHALVAGKLSVGTAGMHGPRVAAMPRATDNPY